PPHPALANRVPTAADETARPVTLNRSRFCPQHTAIVVSRARRMTRMKPVRASRGAQKRTTSSSRRHWLLAPLGVLLLANHNRLPLRLAPIRGHGRVLLIPRLHQMLRVLVNTVIRQHINPPLQ